MSAPVLSVLNSSTVEADYFAPNDELSNIDKEITFTALQHSSDDEDSTAHEVAVTKDDDISQIIIESETNNDIDAENETLSTDLLKVNELPFTNEDMERSINKQLQSDAQYLNDEQQKLLLRRIVCEVGSALSKRFDAAADFILPEVLDEPSTTELILELKTLIEQLSKENSSTTLPTNAEGSPPVSEWVEVNEWQPTPDYGLESPIIAHLLSNWTNDNAKV